VVDIFQLETNAAAVSLSHSCARGGTCPPLENVQARFFSDTTFLFAQKRKLLPQDTFYRLKTYLNGDCSRDSAGKLIVSSPQIPLLDKEPLHGGEGMAEWRGREGRDGKKEEKEEEREREGWRGKGEGRL